MSSFLEIAARNANRVFSVHPLHPRDKRPLLKDWPALATSDKAQIETWAKQFPDANCGVVVDSTRCVLESDALDTFQQLLGMPLPRTFTVQARENRPHLYFLQTEKSRELGNCDLAGIFEFKQDRRFVVAEGSTHPTGAIYKVIDASPEIAIPDWLVGRLITIHQEHKRNGNGRDSAPVEGGRNNYLTSVPGKLRYAGLSKEALELALLQHNDDVCNPPLPEEEVRSITRSVARYDVPEPAAEVTIGGPELKTAVKVADKQSKPVFPDQAWQGTIFSEFAEVVCRGNSIRTRLASEAFRAITGAIAGDQVLCGIAGVRMREYHAIIANRQSGKSYALDCATDFYTKISIKSVFEPMLMVHSGNNSYRISGIGAQRFLPGSSNSFVDELTREKKHKKGEDVDVLVGPLWKPTARLITIQGEAIALFSRLCSPDWTGQALSALVTDLYDSLDTEVAITKDRATPKLPVRLQYSLLLCTQPQIWRKYMAAHMMDSGLFGRFYIIGSEFKPKKVSLPDYSDAELFEEHFGGYDAMYSPD